MKLLSALFLVFFVIFAFSQCGSPEPKVLTKDEAARKKFMDACARSLTDAGVGGWEAFTKCEERYARKAVGQ